MNGCPLGAIGVRYCLECHSCITVERIVSRAHLILMKTTENKNKKSPALFETLIYSGYRHISRLLALTGGLSLMSILFYGRAAFAGAPPPSGYSEPSSTAELSNINDIIHDTVQFISAGIGVLLVVFLAEAGIRYLTAGNNSNQVAAAKKQIANIVLSLVLYIFGLVLLNYISPGGLT